MTDIITEHVNSGIVSVEQKIVNCKISFCEDIE